MNPKAKPMPKSGERNTYCPYYAGCLDFAIDNSWRVWDCSYCQHKEVQPSVTEWDYVLNDPVSYYELPLDIARRIANEPLE